MNYKSQLRGWAIDRALEWAKLRKDDKTTSLDEIMDKADILMDYAYVPREDLESTAKDLFDLVRAAPTGESSIDALIGTLEHIREDRIRQQIDPMPEEEKVVNLKETH